MRETLNAFTPQIPKAMSFSGFMRRWWRSSLSSGPHSSQPLGCGELVKNQRAIEKLHERGVPGAEAPAAFGALSSASLLAARLIV